MSEAPGHESPSQDELDRVAFDAVVRTAPRFGRFIGTGIGIGAFVGIALGLVLPNSTGVGRSIVALLVGLGFAIIGAVVTAAIAVGLDGTKRASYGDPLPWEPPVDDDAPPLLDPSALDEVTSDDEPDSPVGPHTKEPDA